MEWWHFWRWDQATWDSIRGWAPIVVGIVAASIALNTYRLNARIKREEQARLVYVAPGPLAKTGAGHRMSLLAAADKSVTEFVRKAPNSYFRHTTGATTIRNYVVHNKSDELIGPARLVMRYAYSDGSVLELEKLIPVVEPGGEVKVESYARSVGQAQWIDEYVLTFRDSSGRWWTRDRSEPIRYRSGDPLNPRRERIKRWIRIRRAGGPRKFATPANSEGPEQS